MKKINNYLTINLNGNKNIKFKYLKIFSDFRLRAFLEEMFHIN